MVWRQRDYRSRDMEDSMPRITLAQQIRIREVEAGFEARRTDI